MWNLHTLLAFHSSDPVDFRDFAEPSGWDGLWVAFTKRWETEHTRERTFSRVQGDKWKPETTTTTTPTMDQILCRPYTSHSTAITVSKPYSFTRSKKAKDPWAKSVCLIFCLKERHERPPWSCPQKRQTAINLDSNVIVADMKVLWTRNRIVRLQFIVNFNDDEDRYSTTNLSLVFVVTC